MAKYQVKSIAKFAGISPHTLRAWERRYKAVVPERDASNGRRLYSDADAHRLRLLAQLVREGHAIGRVAREETPTLELLSRSKDSSLEQLEPEDPIWQQMYQSVVDSLRSFDFPQLYAALRALRAQRSVEGYLLDVCAPLMRAIGTMVNNDQLNVAHEHVLSAILKMELFELFSSTSSYINPNQKSLLLTTSSGDYHEIGILMAAILGQLRGCRVHYLGPSMPVNALVHATKLGKVEVVVLGFVPELDQEVGTNPQSYLAELDAALPAEIAIWTGGLDTHRLQPELLNQQREWRFFPDLHSFKQLL